MTIEEIKQIVCKHYRVEENNIDTRTRKIPLVFIRQVSMMLSYLYVKKVSMAFVGQNHGGRNHATVLHAIKTVNNIMDTDSTINTDIKDI